MGFIEDKQSFRKLSLGCLLTLGILFAFGYWIFGPRRLLSSFEPSVQEVVLHPDFVEVYRIAGVRSPDRLEKAGDVLANVEPTAPVVRVKPGVMRAISAAMEGSNWHIISPSCDPSPGILFRFNKGTSRVEVLFCAACGSLSVYPSGERSTIGRYCSSREDLVRIVKRLFPKDQDLKDGFALLSAWRREWART